MINADLGYVSKKDFFHFCDGIFDTLRFFEMMGFALIVVTNQSGIGRGFYNKEDFLILTEWMVSKFRTERVRILDVFYCPHLPDVNCECRKPKPGMILDAATKYDLNLKDSWLIGDKETDIVAAINAGINNHILLGSNNIKNSRAKFQCKRIEQTIKYVI